MNTEQRAEGEGRRGQSLELVKRRGLAERVGRMLKGRERCAREDAEEAERLKDEELKRYEAARHEAWRACHNKLVCEMQVCHRPTRAILRAWFARLGATSTVGASMLGDLREQVETDMHHEHTLALLKLALATNVVALHWEDAEVKAEQGKIAKPEDHPQITQITQIARKDDAPAGYILNCPGCGKKFVTPEPFGSLCPWCTAARDGKE